jgi:4-hydroxythreonine-4-phosphate dehydrogenase
VKLLVTQGEERGIGPEIVLKSWPRAAGREGVEVVILGDPGTFARLGDELELPVPGAVEPVEGPSIALAALEEAARRLAAGEADAVATAPVNKARLRAAGFGFPGQTEFFAKRLGAGSYAMMLAEGPLRVVPATIHIGVAEVPAALTEAGLLDTIRTTARALAGDFAIEEPRIAVLGLNPHAGEGGQFGDEEARVIRPAVERAAGEGIRVEGPLPADATFAPRRRSRYDAIVGTYHDQVLAPFKALASGGGVNVTLGLPAVRTSPDHGTAEDIAGRGAADPSSMLAAIDLAIETARNRSKNSV